MIRHLLLLVVLLCIHQSITATRPIKMSINPDPNGDPSQAQDIDPDQMTEQQRTMMENLQSSLGDIDFSTLNGENPELQEMILNSLKGNVNQQAKKKSSSPPKKDLSLTINQLAEFDGSDDDKPIYLSIRRRIYDVTSGAEFYGKGQIYDYLSGKEVARGLATGCLESSGLTYDVRGLNADQKARVQGWVEFFKKKYSHVGYLKAPKIQQDSPVPDDECEEATNYIGIPKK